MQLRIVVFSCSVGMVSSESGLFDVDVIVLDEVHYLSDISRGTVWEEIVSTFLIHNSVFISFIHSYEVKLFSDNLLPKRSSNYMPVGDCCKCR